MALIKGLVVKARNPLVPVLNNLSVSRRKTTGLGNLLSGLEKLSSDLGSHRKDRAIGV